MVFGCWFKAKRCCHLGFYTPSIISKLNLVRKFCMRWLRCGSHLSTFDCRYIEKVRRNYDDFSLLYLVNASVFETAKITRSFFCSFQCKNDTHRKIEKKENFFKKRKFWRHRCYARESRFSPPVSIHHRMAIMHADGRSSFGTSQCQTRMCSRGGLKIRGSPRKRGGSWSHWYLSHDLSLICPYEVITRTCHSAWWRMWPVCFSGRMLAPTRDWGTMVSIDDDFWLPRSPHHDKMYGRWLMERILCFCRSNVACVVTKVHVTG